MTVRKIIKTLSILGLSTILYGCEKECKPDNNINNLQYEIVEETNSEIHVSKRIISDKWYLYQITSEKDKELYGIIYNSLIDIEDSIDLNLGDADKVKFLFKCVIYDNPQIFYVDNYQYIKHTDNTITILPIYNMKPVEIEEAKRSLDEYVNNVLQHIKPEMTDYEKELIIYNHIVENTEYYIKSEYNQNLYSVMLGESVCLGYSKMFQYICQQVNIPCTIITGQDEKGVGHAWNAVFVDGYWYMVDCTNSKGLLGDNKDQISYYYFNVTREQILRSYSIDNLVPTPECYNIESEYFYHNHYYFNKVDIEKYSELIRSAIINNRSSLIIRCSNTSIYNQMMERLISKKELINMFEINTSIEQIADPKLLIIKIEW